MLGFIPARAKDPAPQCMDGLHERFVQADLIRQDQMFVHLPVVTYDGDSEEPAKKSSQGKLDWKDLPEDVVAQVVRIAEYHGHAIYRATYEQRDESHPFFYLVLAYDEKDNQMLRPFFVAGSGEISEADGWISSKEKDPFSLKASIDWRGSGHVWALLTYHFNKSGPHLSERRDGSMRSKTKVRSY